MVEINIRWTEKSLKEYSKFIFINNRRNKILLAVLAAIFLLVLAGCLVLVFTGGHLYGLFFAALLVVCWGAGALFLRFAMNTYAKNAINESTDDDPDSLIVDDSEILVCKNRDPVGKLKWDKIKNIYFNKRAAVIYLITESDVLLILEEKNIVNGSMEVLTRIADGKNRELSKKA